MESNLKDNLCNVLGMDEIKILQDAVRCYYLK